MPKKKVVYAGLLHDSYTDENGGEDKMNYEMIQDNIDASTLAAIYAKTEEKRRLHAGDVLYWKNKKAEYMNTHNVKGELLNV